MSFTKPLVTSVLEPVLKGRSSVDPTVLIISDRSIIWSDDMEGGLDAAAGAVRCDKGRGKNGERRTQSALTFNMGPPCAEHSSCRFSTGTEGEERLGISSDASHLQLGCAKWSALNQWRNQLMIGDVKTLRGRLALPARS